ncbi:MAG: family 16 glycoside hydrolase [Spirosomataceae bacterium]
MKISISGVLICLMYYVNAQPYQPALRNVNSWVLSGRTIETINENGKDGIKFSENEGRGLWLLKNYTFSEGTVEFDVKGRNVLQKSFVGFAFHYQNDSTYDVVYFRPFNFSNPDTARRVRAVQYMSLPDFGWSKLRAGHPQKYESSVNPVPDPDDWFHAKVVIKGKKVIVFVNNSSKPSLEAEKLTDTKSGQIALWVDTGSDGSFANLTITQ